MNEAERKSVIQDLNFRMGGDLSEISAVYDLERELLKKKKLLQSYINLATDDESNEFGKTVKAAEKNTRQIEELKQKNSKLKVKIEAFLRKTEPLKNELENRFVSISKLEEIYAYLQTFEKIDDLSSQLKQCNDDEQAVLLYGDLKELCQLYLKGHRAAYIREYTHYWHNILKDRFTKQYDDILKLLKWPFTTTSQEYSPPPKEVLTKFDNVTKFLLLIEEPKCTQPTSSPGDYGQDQEPCIPVRILLRPLKKRFAFHFTGSRQTARIDRPEWFLTQTLTWIKDHQTFLKKNVQPVANKLSMNYIKVEDEFNAGLIALAAERLHTVLSLYHTQGLKGEMIDVDAAFAHAVDETLGFNKELVTITGKDVNSVLSVLTKAEIFVRWLSVEKKYALAKMDETLSNGQWMEPVCAGSGSAGFIPRGADWIITLLRTIEERYTVLPQPGHRLQFLELQLELIEEWRVRLTQLLSAAISSLTEETFLSADATPHPLTAVINAAHHTRTVLLQWAHSLHYLQLHYYRSQFQHFTQQQHHDNVLDVVEELPEEIEEFVDVEEKEIDETMSLNEVEVRAKKLAMNEVSRKNSQISEAPDQSQQDLPSQVVNLTLDNPSQEDVEESGVFVEAPALLAHLRDAGLGALADHMLLEFKAALRDYKKQKWHAMPKLDDMDLTVSPPLCRPLGGLCARLHSANAKLVPTLCSRLRSHIAAEIDAYVYEEVILENWWNSGGAAQLHHDVKRNLIPAFAPPNKVAAKINLLPRLSEASKILKLSKEQAKNLRSLITKDKVTSCEYLLNLNILHIHPDEVLQILNQRTDISDGSASSVMELF